MKGRIWTIVAAVAVLALLASLAVGTTEKPAPAAADRPAVEKKLSPEQEASLAQLNDLRKQLRIAKLELRLLEAKEAPEKEIAAKAEQVYRLQGQLHAFVAKHRELGGLRTGRGRGLGAGPGGRMGLGRGLGMGRGLRGQGMGRSRGMMGQGMGPGRGLGARGERGMGMGQGMGRGQELRERARLRLGRPTLPEGTAEQQPPVETPAR